MEKEFEKIEYGLKLLKDEKEKIDEKVNIAEKILRYLEKEKPYPNFKIKYAFSLLFIFLILFLTVEKLNMEKSKNFYVLNINEKKEKEVPSMPKQISESMKVKKKEFKIKKIDNKEKGELLPIEESIKFTEEIDKIISLFTIDLKMEGENAEI
ncbi:MAG: hypothetical protein ACP5OB_04615 [Candidatus Ratteibacteria bacterium]